MSALDELSQCPDISTLKPALKRLCEKFGEIASLDVLTATHEGRRQAICFPRLVSPEGEERLMKTLGVGRFGGEIVFVVNLNAPVTSEDAGPSSEWADLEGFQ
jgi:hypothetical protein